MTTKADVADAEKFARKQRHAAATLLHVDEGKVTPADAALCEEVKAAAQNDLPEFDRLLGVAAVGALFARGVMLFKSKAPTAALLLSALVLLGGCADLDGMRCKPNIIGAVCTIQFNRV